MPKEFIRRHLPSPEKISTMRGMGLFAHRLHDPSLWHLNRRSASLAAFWGIWCAFLPMPLHTLPAIVAAIVFRFNLPLCILLVWVNNPLTLIPIVYLSYMVGVFLVPSFQPTHAPTGAELYQMIHELLGEHHLTHLSVSDYIEPVLLGMLVLGFVLACVAYIGVNYVWHRRVMQKWHKRQKHRLRKHNGSP